MGKLTSVSITEISIEDHSRLGGPMGFESTSTMESKLFFDRDAAVDWAVKYVQRNYPESYKQYAVGKNPRAALIKQWGDLGPIGVMIGRRTVFGTISAIKPKAAKPKPKLEQGGIRSTWGRDD